MTTWERIKGTNCKSWCSESSEELPGGQIELTGGVGPHSHFRAQNPSRGQQARSRTVFGLGIGNQCGQIDTAGFSNFTQNLMLRQCRHHRSEVLVYLESHQKPFGLDSKVLVSVPENSAVFPVFSFFNSLFCVQWLQSVCILPQPLTQGCIHQSSQGTTANWFLNRISLLPAIRLHYDFLKSLINKCECREDKRRVCERRSGEGVHRCETSHVSTWRNT